MPLNAKSVVISGILFFISDVAFAQESRIEMETNVNLGAHAHYSLLLDFYSREFSQLPSTSRAHSSGRLLYEQRRQALKEFTICHQDLPLKLANYDDLLALINCHEHLHDWKHALRLSEAAFDIAPMNPNSYAPLVRSLLNNGRTEDAAKIVAFGQRTLSIRSEVCKLHHLLYIRYKHLQMFPQAASHMEQLFDHYRVSWVSTPHDAIHAGLLAERLVECFDNSGQRNLGVEYLATFYGEIDLAVGDIALTLRQSAEPLRSEDVYPYVSGSYFLLRVGRLLRQEHSVVSPISPRDAIDPLIERASRVPGCIQTLKGAEILVQAMITSQQLDEATARDIHKELLKMEFQGESQAIAQRLLFLVRSQLQ